MEIPTLNLRAPGATGPRRVFVVFTDITDASAAPSWVRLFTAPGFRHVFVLLPAKLGTVVVNQLAQGMSADWAPYDPLACAICCARKGWRVLELDTTHTRDYVNYGAHTCVSVIKALIGVRSWWIITPRQLYDHLLKHGANHVTEQLPPQAAGPQ